MPEPVAGDLDTARARIARVHQQLQVRGLAMRPAPPEPTTCCGRGCNGCVWEGWYQAVQWWEEDAPLPLQSYTAADRAS